MKSIRKYRFITYIWGIFFIAIVGTNHIQAQPSGLVARYQADGNATDSVSGNNGTLHNVAFTSGHSGQAFRFGTGYLNIPNSPSLELQQLSVAAWVRSLSPGSVGFYNYLLSMGSSNCNGYGAFQLQTDNTKGLRFGIGTFGGAQSPDAGPGIWDGNWHYVVGTYDGAVVRLFVDGNEVGSGTPLPNHQINYNTLATNNLIVGDFNPSCGNFRFQGDIDDLQIYNRALTATEISQQVSSPLIISEFRLRGYFGTHDEFVELYNNTDSNITVSTTDGSGGWTLVVNGGYVLAFFPNGTVFPARSHFLTSEYYIEPRSSVRNYDGVDATYGYFDGFSLQDDTGLALFKTNNAANFTNAYRLDSVGFTSVANPLFREGTGLPPIGANNGEYSFVRRAVGFQAQDTDDNTADFVFVSTTGGIFNGVQSVLGAPGPERTTSPRRGNLPGSNGITASLLDTNVSATDEPNQFRAFEPVGNGDHGTFELRRKITNNTGSTITRLRLRVVDITSAPNIPGTADLRILSSPDTTVTLSNSSTVTVKGTTLDQPPVQFQGGGLNSSLSVALPPGGLANGGSINIRVLLGVMQTGNYRFETDIPLNDTQGFVFSGSSNPSIYGKIGNTSNGPTIGFSNVTVTLSGTHSATTTTDQNGNYAFYNLTPGGNYTVTPSKQGYVFNPVLHPINNLNGNQEANFTGGFIQPSPGDILISEFRTRGSIDNIDEFVEIYNNTDIDFTVSTSDESAGWTIVVNGGYGIVLIPNGTVIRGRQYFVGTQFYNTYSRANSIMYTYTNLNFSWGYFDGFQIPDDTGLALFKTNNPANYINANRLDSVGFSPVINPLFREGTGLPPIGANNGEYSFVRRAVGFQAQDTDDNTADFVFVSTTGGIFNGVQSVLGAPGPEGSQSPIRANLPGRCGITKSLLDPMASASDAPNAVDSGGTLSLRRKITNNTGVNVTRLRFRVVDISTLGDQSPGEADLRVVSSADTTATLIDSSNVTIKGTSLDQPPNQTLGGGLNSSLSVTLPPGGLAPGASVNVQFLLNIVQAGNYRFEIDVPELPCDITAPTTTALSSPTANAAGWNNSDVNVSLSATDDANGIGVKELTYSATGAQTISPTTVNSSTANLTISAEGETTIIFFARDFAGNIEPAKTITVRIDKTAPMIFNMPPNQAVEGTGPNGAAVSWSQPTATDALDSNVAVTCSPSSGSMFGYGTTTVTCTATDKAGNMASQNFTVEVTNAPPTADAGGSYQVGEGGAVSLFGLGTDYEESALTYEWDLDDNGTFETAGQNPVFSAAGLDGPTSRSVKLRVTDSAGLSAVNIATVNVLNVAPTLSSVTGPVAPQAINTAVNLTLSYTDPAGSLDTYTVTTDWGDVATDNNTSHIYTSTGVYRVRATVADDDGGISNEAVYEYVVVYDPNGGFVTGGGWIMSPVGAYTANPSLNGKATFGFVSKYQKGTNQPTGNTEFQFHAGDFRFKSDSYDWLVVAGAKAQFKGIGSINGVSGYSFILTATDGQVSGGGGVDKFRIKIWNANGVVYDNVSGTSDQINEAHPQAIGGGSIVIHSDK